MGWIAEINPRMELFVLSLPVMGLRSLAKGMPDSLMEMVKSTGENVGTFPNSVAVWRKLEVTTGNWPSLVST